MATTETCHRCVYAHFDLNLWARTLWSGFPLRPTCANRPGSLGVMREVSGGVCRNYREKPADPDARARQIILTNGMIAYVDAADYEEISRYTWCLASGGYAARSENHKWIFMHRQIMNPPEGMFVDHIKGNRLDNTCARLHVCTLSENAQNRPKRANATSRYRGVSYSKKREEWVVALPREANQKFVGAYDDELEAARAYDRAAVLYLNDDAKLNFPEEWPPERKAEVRATRDAAPAEPDHPAPGSRTEGLVHRPAESVARKCEETPRKPHDARRTTKPSRVETQGRRGRQPAVKSKRAVRRAPSNRKQAPKKNAPRRRKGPPTGRQR